MKQFGQENTMITSCPHRTSAACLRWALAVMAVLILSRSSRADEPIYTAPSAAEARTEALQWVAARGVADEQILQHIGTLWADLAEDSSPRELFNKVIETFVLADPDTEQFVAGCSLVRPTLVPPDAELLTRHEDDAFYSGNLSLFYARYLVQRTMYDEALEVFARIDPAAVVDPATCLFYTAVCRHELLQTDEALATVGKLLDDTQNVPESYLSVARLMRYELEKLKEQSLNSIARRMKDSKRRLQLGRGGQRVRKVQDEIVDALDAIIEKLEQQSGGGGGGGAAPSNSNRSSGAADDSRVKGDTAPGEVDPKKFRKPGSWGSLPPKKEASARNLLNRRFPAHYRQAVEQYFKKLAQRGENE